MTNRNEELSKLTKDLMFREPHYGLFLIMLNRVWTNSIPTAAVAINGINYELLFNEEFWDSLSYEQRIGVIKHELGHIGFHHLTDFGHLSNKKIANIAMDITINQYIAENELPKGPMLPSTFPELKLELRKGTKYYYDKLMEAAEKKSSSNLNSILQSDQIKVTVDINGVPHDVLIDPHNSINTAFPEATAKVVKSQIERVINEIQEQTAKMCGSTPGFFTELFGKLTKIDPPKFNWKAFFRRFVSGSGEIFTKKTRRKESTRFKGGPGLKIKQKAHCLIAIDTSGSVSTPELKEFLGEIHHMHKTGLAFTVVQCDTTIKGNPVKYRPNMDIEIHGRGGTNFTPVCEYFNENLHQYTCLVYFTDGEASTSVTPKGRVLWVHSSKSNINNELPGQKIKLVL
jgi:predicted metal-dependent peptidase